MPSKPQARVWALLGPHRGDNNQVLALARALGLPFEEKMLRYNGVLFMKGTDRKVIFQGVHQLMGSDMGPKWAPGEKKNTKMVFIGLDLPRDVFQQGLEQCLA